jgi:hypothetical protein
MHNTNIVAVVDTTASPSYSTNYHQPSEVRYKGRQSKAWKACRRLQFQPRSTRRSQRPMKKKAKDTLPTFVSSAGRAGESARSTRTSQFEFLASEFGETDPNLPQRSRLHSRVKPENMDQHFWHAPAILSTTSLGMQGAVGSNFQKADSAQALHGRSVLIARKRSMLL